jgi:hypothetical protein
MSTLVATPPVTARLAAPARAARIRPVTRWVAALVVFFLADAAQLLLLLPDRTGELFAWPIDSALSSFVLASAYVGGGYFFVRVARGGEWARVAAGFPPVILFVCLVALATALHLDRFTHGSLAFVAWAVIYAAAPVGLPLLVLSQQGRRERDSLPRAARAGMLAAGVAVTAAGLLVFALPDAAGAVWPWALTPLTARIVAAVMALFGSVWVAVAAQDSRAGARIPLEAHALGLAFLLLGAARGHAEIAWERPLTAVLAAGVAAMLLADGWLLARLVRGR